MKEHIIRAILYQDMSVKWKNAELNGDVNVHLNVHQKTRQFVEVELGDFLLNDGEWILASFEKTIEGDIHHENPSGMDKVEGQQGVFRLQLPTIVHNTPGEWGVQFLLVTDYNPATGDYTTAYPFDIAKFFERSSFLDDGLTIPGKDNLSALHAEAVQKIKLETQNATAIAANTKAIPLVVDETLILNVSRTSIVAGYANSIDLASLNKTPTVGERFTGICKTSDNYVYSFAASVTGTVNESGYVPFVFDEVTLLHSGITDTQVATNATEIKKIKTDYLKKIADSSLRNQLYGKASTGAQRMYDVTTDMLEGAVVERYTDGHIIVPLFPTFIGSAASRDYVDGMRIGLTLDDNYVLTVTLYAKDGTALNSQKVDFPVEEMIVDGVYDDENEKIVLTLKNGNTVDIPVGDLVDGLISSTEKGQPNGVATLGADGKVPSEQLPEMNYVEKTGESWKIYGTGLLGLDKSYSVDHSTASGTTMGDLPLRGADGGLVVPNESITEGTSVINKKYADAIKEQAEFNRQALIQSGLLSEYKATIEDAYNERVTADGANVLDGSMAKLIKVVGSTVACKNLLNPDLLSGGSFVAFNGKSCYLFQDAGEGFSFTTDFLPNTQYTINMQIYRDADVDYATVFVVHYTDGTASTNWDARKNGVLTTTAGKTVERITGWSSQGKNCYIDLETAQINEGTTLLPYQPYFTGLKSASFGGIESKNAGGTETSTLTFPKTATPLGTTIDFENKKITNTHADYTFTGNESWAKGSSAPSGFERWYCSIPNMAIGGSSNYNYGVCDKYLTFMTAGEYLNTKNEGVIFGFGNNYFQLVLVQGQTAQSVQELTEGMKIRYLLDAEYYTSTDFTESNEYTAYKGGTETVLENDGTEYGAENTLSQNYILVTEVN